MKIINLVANGHTLSYNVLYCNSNQIYVEYTLITFKCSKYIVCFKNIYSKNKPIQHQHNFMCISNLNEFD